MENIQLKSQEYYRFVANVHLLQVIKKKKEVES